MLFPNVRSEGVKINTIISTATQYAGTKKYTWIELDVCVAG